MKKLLNPSEMFCFLTGHTMIQINLYESCTRPFFNLHTSNETLIYTYMIQVEVCLFLATVLQPDPDT